MGTCSKLKYSKRDLGQKSWEIVIQKRGAPQAFGATLPKSLRQKVEVNTHI